MDTAKSVPPRGALAICTFNCNLARWIVEHATYFGTETRNMLLDAQKGLLRLTEIRPVGAIRIIGDTAFAFPSSGNHQMAAALFQSPDSLLPFIDLSAAGFSDGDLPVISKVFQLVADKEATQALDLRGLISEYLDPLAKGLIELQQWLSEDETFQPVGLHVFAHLQQHMENTSALQAVLSGKGPEASQSKVSKSRTLRPIVVFVLSYLVEHCGIHLFFSFLLCLSILKHPRSLGWRRSDLGGRGSWVGSRRVGTLFPSSTTSKIAPSWT